MTGSEHIDSVRIAPAPDWILLNEVDDTYRPPVTTAETALLVSHQHHASKHESYTRVVRRLETLSAVQQLSMWRCDFDPAVQQVTIHSLSVQRGGIAKEHAALTRLKFLQREEGLESFMIDGTITVIVAFEDVRVGDVVDTSFTVHSRPRMFVSEFSLLTAVPTGSYTRMFHLSVRFPLEMPMQWMTDSKMIECEVMPSENGESVWQWQVQNFAPRSPEPQMPSWHFHGRFIQVSSYTSWASIAEGFRIAWREKFDDADLENAAEEFGACATLDERIEKALRFVQDDIRYLSVNTEFGGQIPTAPGAVLKRRYGDCKDKAFLLAHLLRKLGIPARPVLVNTVWQRRVGEFLPSPNVFNHVVIEWEFDGKRHWADATIPLQGGGTRKRYLPEFGLGLPISLGVTALEVVDSPPDGRSNSTLHESFYIDTKTNVATLHVLYTARGQAADSMRRDIGHRGSYALAEHRLQWYRSTIVGIERLAEMQIRDDREQNELLLGETYRWRNATMSSDESGVCVFQHFAHLVQGIIVFPDSTDRIHPLALFYPCVAEHRIECITEGHLRADCGGINVTTGAFRVRASLSAIGNRRIYDYSYRSFRDHVDVEEYRDHRQRTIDSLHACRVAFFLRTDRRIPDDQLARIEVLPKPPAKGGDSVLPVLSTSVAPAYGPVASALQTDQTKRSVEMDVTRRLSGKSKSPPTKRRPSFNFVEHRSLKPRSLQMGCGGIFLMYVLFRIIFRVFVGY
ncbi:MAG: DUF3857 domain-containing transglutaminase family protein [Chthoniobacter sp.]|nr:DUF3857 domain-containing transglutaminase family protein [Chthoniobacter sp.]